MVSTPYSGSPPMDMPDSPVSSGDGDALYRTIEDNSMLITTLTEDAEAEDRRDRLMLNIKRGFGVLAGIPVVGVLFKGVGFGVSKIAGVFSTPQSPRDLLATAADTNNPVDLIDLVQSHANDPEKQADIINTLATSINGNNAIAQDLAAQASTYTPSWDPVQVTPAYDGYGDVGTAVEILNTGEMSPAVVNTDMLQQLQEMGGKALLDDGVVSQTPVYKIERFLYANNERVAALAEQHEDIQTTLNNIGDLDEQQLSAFIGRISEVEFDQYEQGTGIDLHALWDNAFNEGGAENMEQAHGIVSDALLERSSALAARTKEYESIMEQVQDAVGTAQVQLPVSPEFIPGGGNPAIASINPGALAENISTVVTEHVAPALQRGAEFIGNHLPQIGIGFAGLSTGKVLFDATRDAAKDSKQSGKKWHHAFGQQLGRFGNATTLTRNAAIGSAVVGLGNPVTAGVAGAIGTFNLSQLAAKVGNHFTNRSIDKDQQTIESSQAMLQRQEENTAGRDLTPMELASREALTNDIKAKTDTVDRKEQRVSYWKHYTELEWSDFNANRDGSFASKTKDNLHKAQEFGANLLKSTFGKIGEKARGAVDTVSPEQLAAFEAAAMAR